MHRPNISQLCEHPYLRSALNWEVLFEIKVITLSHLFANITMCLINMYLFVWGGLSIISSW
jgi:hypothetical protein